MQKRRELDESFSKVDDRLIELEIEIKGLKDLQDLLLQQKDILLRQPDFSLDDETKRIIEITSKLPSSY